MTETTAERVAAGVAWLDEHDPGWWREDAPEHLTRDAQPIDLDRLDIDDPCRCVLGYRWGHFGHALVDALRDASDVALGFDGDSADEVPELTAEWRRVISERREAVTVDA